MRHVGVAGLILVGITTLLPFAMSPSRIVNSSRKHQYGCRCSGISCMLLGKPVRIRSVSSAKVGLALYPLVGIRVGLVLPSGLVQC